MNKDQPIDVLICTVVNEDSEVSYHVINDIENLETLQDIKNETWVAYGDNSYGKNEMPDAVNEFLKYCDFSEDFPYEAFKNAKNPKIITVYY